MLGVTHGSAAVVVLVLTTVGASRSRCSTAARSPGALVMGALIYALAYRDGVSRATASCWSGSASG